MKFFLTTILLVACVACTHAQNMEWVKQIGNTYGEMKPVCVERDDSGNMFIFGTYQGKADLDMDTSSSFRYAVRQHYFLAKYTPVGQLVWADTLDPRDQFASFNPSMSLKVDHAGQAVISAEFRDSMDVDPSASVSWLYANSMSNQFFCQYNSNGQLNWAFAIDCDNKTVFIDSMNAVYFAGSFSGAEDFDPGASVALLTPTGNNAYILKVNQQGQFIWAKCFQGNSSSIRSLVVNGNNDVIACGSYTGLTDFDPNAGTHNVMSTGLYDNVFINALDSNGNYLWTQLIALDTYQAAQVNSYQLKTDFNQEIIFTADVTGNLVFDPGGANQAYTATASGWFGDVFIAKYAANGNLQWVKQLGDAAYPGIMQINQGALGIDSLNRIYLLGSFGGTIDADPDTNQVFSMSANLTNDIFLLRLSDQGAFQYVKHYASNIFYTADVNHQSSMHMNDHFGPIIAGRFNQVSDFDPGAGVQQVASNQEDAYFLQLDHSGAFQWVRTIESTGSGLSTHSVVHDGYLYVYGTFFGTTDFDPDINQTDERKSWVESGYVSKYKTDGTYIGTIQIGDGSKLSVRIRSLAFDETGHMYLCGHFTGPVDMDPGPGVYTLQSKGASDLFLMKLDSAMQFVWAKGYGDTSTVPGTMEFTSGAAFNPGNQTITITGKCSVNSDLDPGAGTWYDPTANASLNSFLIQADTAGNLIWARVLPAFINGVYLDRTGNALLKGYINSTVDIDPGPGTTILNIGSMYSPGIFLKFDPNGQFLFAKMYATRVSAIAIDSSNHYFLTGDYGGTVQFETGNPGSQLYAPVIHTFILKYDSAGVYKWVKEFEQGRNTPFNICADRDQNIYVIGNFEDTVDFQPGPGVYPMMCQVPAFPPASIENGYLVKLNGNGDLVWSNQYMVDGMSFGLGYVQADTSGNVYVCGNLISDSLKILTPGSSQTLYVSGINDMLIQKIGQCPYHADSSSILSCGPYSVGGMTFTQSGVYHVITGCDSVQLLTLLVENINTSVTKTGDTLFAQPGYAGYQWYDCDAHLPLIGQTTSHLALNGLPGNFAVIISTPNCTDTSACFSVFPVHLDDQSASTISLFPNPCVDWLHVRTQSLDRERDYMIRNSIGQLMAAGTLQSDHTLIPVHSFGDGMYAISIEGIGVFKFMVHHQ